MNISINGTPVKEMYPEASNLEDILLRLSRTSVPSTHLVSSIMVNGRIFSEVYPGQAKEIGIERISDLKIDTVSMEQFASASLKDCVIFINRISASVLKTAELFRMYDETEANEQYAKLLESMRALFQFIDITQKNLNWDFTSSMYNGQPVLKEWKKLLDMVGELKNIQEEGDLILLADLLEYELAPSLDAWGTIFKEKSENYRSC